EGVVAAVKEVGLRVPLVVRLEGTNVELGKEIIAKSNLNVTSAHDLDDAAQKIVKAVKDRAGLGNRVGRCRIGGCAAASPVQLTHRPCRAVEAQHPRCPSSSTRTPRSSARASPARTAPSIPSRRSLTAPKWSAAHRQAKAAPVISGCPCSTRWPRRRSAH